MEIFLIIIAVILVGVIIFFGAQICTWLRLFEHAFATTISSELGTADLEILEEYPNCNALISFYFDQPQEINITDFSMFEDHNLVGIMFFETRLPQNEKEKLADGQTHFMKNITLRCVREIGETGDGIWLWYPQ